MADYRAAARRAAQKAGLDPGVFERQIQQESGFDPDARSPAGALGIAQIMPGTAAGWGVDPHDPIASLNAAARNMASYVRKYGSYENALRAYNAGPGRIQASHAFAETNAYVQRILHGHSPAAPVSAAAAKAHGSKASSSPIASAQSAEQAFAPVTLPERPRVQVTAPTRPSFAANMPGADYQAPQSTGAARAPRLDVNSALNAIASASQATPDSGGGAAPKRGRGGGKSAPAPSAGGTANFEGHTVAAWIKPALVYARKNGWKGEINSGFRTLAEQTRIYNSGVRPAAKPGTSNHEGAEFPRGAVDVTDPQALSNILAKSPYRKQLQWAGSKDPPHFSHPHGGSY